MAGGIDWFRWHHGSVTDPKFQLVARKASARFGDVMTVWAFVLEAASADADRGHVGAIDAEAIDLMLGAEDGTTDRILSAMQERGLIDGERISSWDKRQPKRERPDDNSTERTRAFREKQRQETPENATERQETPRGEESREEKKEEKARALSEPQGTNAGAVCKAMRQTGLSATNPGDPRFLALLAQGASEAEFVGLAKEAAEKGKGWAWVLSVLQARRTEAAAISLAPRPEDVPKPWQETADGIKAKGAELGMRWSDDGWVNGECIPFPTYRARVLHAAGVPKEIAA